MDKKSAIRAATFAILLITYVVFRPQIEKAMGWSKPVQETEQVETAETSKKKTEVQTISNETIKELAKAPSVKEAVAEIKAVDVQLAKEEELLFSHADNDVFQAVLLPSQGIYNITLNEFKKTQDKDSEALLIGSDKFASLGLRGSAATWQFTPAKLVSQVKSPDGKTVQEVVVERLAVKQGLKLRQKWQLIDGQKYRYKYSVTFENISTGATNVKGLRLNCGYMEPISRAQGFFANQAAGMDQAVDVLTIEDKVETEIFKSVLSDIQEQEEEKGLKPGEGEFLIETEEALKWISVKNQYFTTVIDFEKSSFEKAYIRYEPLQVIEEGKETTINIVSAEGSIADFSLNKGESKTFDFDCYSGPQEIEELKALPNKKKGIMQLSFFMFTKISWVGWLSENMLSFIVSVHSAVEGIGFIHSIGDYGVAILLITILIKLLFWPLTNYSNKSMKKMSSLGPLMKEINEKYKDDPQLKQQKVMALYREHGVNPMAGCLPMLLQMPVFIALFNTLRGAIELRHSSFLWASDLSQPDTIATIMGVNINPLAILWAGSMVLNQKIMPTSASADPMQKKMMMLMPVAMLFFCYGMPSGLTLYWTCNTLMTIVQYYFMNRDKGAETKAKKA